MSDAMYFGIIGLVVGASFVGTFMNLYNRAYHQDLDVTSRRLNDSEKGSEFRLKMIEELRKLAIEMSAKLGIRGGLDENYSTYSIFGVVQKEVYKLLDDNFRLRMGVGERIAFGSAAADDIGNELMGKLRERFVGKTNAPEIRNEISEASKELRDQCKDFMDKHIVEEKIESRQLDKTIRELQTNLPWTIRYSRDFRANPQSHKDFAHSLVHVTKALGILSAFVDDMDHRRATADDSTLRDKYGKYVADLVVCALRAANTFPGGVLDIQREVVTRIESKNEVKL